MISSSIKLILCLLLLLPVICQAAQTSVRYDQQIRPILAEYCFQCHGPDASHREADLRLDRESDIKEHVIAASGESELIRRIVASDDSLRMPPPETGKKLNEQEIALIQQWLAEGARYEGHWAYEPIVKPVIPILQNELVDKTDQALSEIDSFVLQSLQARGLSLTKPIDRHQLIRRATLDLIGLPPTWDEVTAFVNDESEFAYERLIERLLDSPAYGQRWGRHWLDVARYADTHGGAAIGFTVFPFSYTYRDYVIAAFNQDLPYDQFIVEQLAADQLGLEEHDPALAGLGFLTVGMQYRNRNDLIDDQIDVITRGLMGLTVSCARCHDHKFDAISIKDYYSLYACLANSSSPDTLPIVGVTPSTPETVDYQQKLTELKLLYDEMARDQMEVMRSRLRMQVGLYLRELAKGTTEQDLSTQFLSYRTDDMRPAITNRWLAYMAAIGEQDPVFGPWHKLMRINPDNFGAMALEQIESLEKENPEAAKMADFHALGAAAAKWNPRVLEALAKKQPQSMQDVADAYGSLFAEVHQEWLQSLGQSSMEALTQDSVVPDEDAKHLVINSPIHRQLRWHLYGPDTPTAVPDTEASKLLNRTVADMLSGKRNAIHQLHLSSPASPPRAMVLRESREPKQFHVFLRGNPLSRGEPVEPKFLSVLSASGSGDETNAYNDGQRRLGLARSIVDRDNPLTRRVLVNWVWQHHFGQGLVRTADDFGTRGRAPTHPLLLDYLAETLLEDDWSIKKLHRRIMLTEVYRQGSIESEASRTIDPENDLLWRMPRRRLDLEAMRDAMLAVSGELDLTVGGRPFQFTTSPAVPRRSVYGFINRDVVSNLASTFDVANPNACTVKRPDTTVPQQTLFALNSDFIQDRAAKLASVLQGMMGTGNAARVTWLYKRLYSRDPDADELNLALQFIGSGGESANGESSSSSNAWQRMIHALLASNEFIFVD